MNKSQFASSRLILPDLLQLHSFHLPNWLNWASNSLWLNRGHNENASEFARLELESELADLGGVNAFGHSFTALINAPETRSRTAHLEEALINCAGCATSRSWTAITSARRCRVSGLDCVLRGANLPFSFATFGKLLFGTWRDFI